MSDTNNLPHLFVQGFVSSEKYTYAGPVPMGEAKMPPRDRAAHGVSIREQLHQARQQNENLRGATINDEEPSRIILEVHSEPDFELELKSLEPRSQGVELACVREEKDEQGRDQRIAVIHVPAGRLNYFVKLVEQYLTAQVASGKPKNQKLIESISRIRLATLRSFWTDDGVEFPLADKAIWWEVWLRASGDQSPWDSFALLAEQAGLGLGKETIRFPDRLVGLCYGTPDQLSSAAEILDMLAEARRAKENPAAFIAFGPIDQAEWVAGLRTRIAEPAADAPAVCVLDRGMVVNPLLEAALSPADLHKYDPSWPLSDPVTPFDAEAGHGTEMADVALFGDQLPELLAGSQAVPLRHRLESVRILPPRRHPDDPRLYGAITAQAAYRVESYANRPRVFCMAVTADGRDRGKPTSWSGEVDQLCAGVRDGHRRLFVVSAGNTALDQRHRYPESNDTDPVQDPAQAWNAVTVGAFTDRVQFPQVGTFSGSRPIAHAGDLSPSSTTSLGWLREWPFKPDVVLEGGNQVFHPVKGWVLDPDEMALLTTAHATGGTLLVNFRDTSAATAQAARMLAIIRAEYPDYWPETVRALLVHSAVWNPSMRQAFCDQKVGEKKRAHWRLRRYGYGVPNLNRALRSARNSLTLISQESLQPFEKVRSELKTKDMHIHALPWPVRELAALGEKPVAMRVTLSYFIEPKPGRRGGFARTRHRYQSHGLRFEVRRPVETLDEFRQRISRAAREDGEEYAGVVGDTKGWVLGPDLRTRGSLHSDWWRGTAAELASCGHIAVYPVTGWWREQSDQEYWSRQARYALVVSIHTDETAVDLYTSIAAVTRATVPAQVDVDVDVDVDVEI